MASTVRASSGGGTTSTRSPHLYSQLSRSSSPDGQQDDGDEDEKGSTFGGGGYEYARRPPRTKRLLRLFLSTASVSFLGLLVLLALLPPRSRPKPLLEVLATFAGEDAHVYTTRREYCSPLILERNDGASMETTRWDPLEREYWATSITGGDLLDREYPPRVVVGMVKIVHQSWKTHVVPARFKAWSETWREYNGEKDGWMHVIWSDEDNARLVREHYGQWEELYRGFKTEIHRADFARNLYMHRFGGVYADLDVLALLPSDQVLAMASMVSPPLTIPADGSKSFVAPPRAFIARMGPDDSFAHSLPNAWFASTIPGHPFWLLPLRFAADRVAGGETGGPEWITGPVGVFESEKIWRDVSDDLIDDPLLQGVEGELVIVPADLVFPFAWSTNWIGLPDLARCICWGRSHAFEPSTCRDLFPQAGALTFWTKSWSD